jgi:hypothetical protein
LKDELRKIAKADDLHIAPFREDGATYCTQTWIWSVDSALASRRAKATLALHIVHRLAIAKASPRV